MQDTTINLRAWSVQETESN